jgi:5-methylthioadenosine/S-adenosylhomocysteine deaminase
MTQYDLAIQNCHMLSPDLSVQADTTLLIQGSRIAAIQSSKEDSSPYQAALTLDGRGKLAMPGLVDAHTHSAQQFLRGSVVDELPMIWTRILVPFESALTPEDVYAGARLFCLENLKAGTTAFAESGGPHMQATAQAAVESGLRGCIARSTMDAGDFVPEGMKTSAEDTVRLTEELYKSFHGAGNDRIHIWFAVRQAMTSTPSSLKLISEASKSLGTGVHIHLAEHLDEVSFCLRNYGLRPAELFDSFDLLGSNVLAAHSVRLAEREIKLMSEKGTNAVHCPRSNLGSHGFSKTPLLLALGVNIGLGTDGASGSRLEMFEPMRLLKSAIQARFGIEINDPLCLPALETLRMATQGGARALMLQDEIGTLEVGKKADIILLDIDQPHIAPTANLPQTIVMAAGPGDVNDVIVDGQVLVKDRKCPHLDEEEIRHEAGKAFQRIARRAGLALPGAYYG